jgi:hypothetical protein
MQAVGVIATKRIVSRARIPTATSAALPPKPLILYPWSALCCDIIASCEMFSCQHNLAEEFSHIMRG